MKKIRVLIVDDHTVVRGGLKLFLLAFPELELVGEASTGQMAIELCKLYEPDVVLMDLIMPGLSGIEATRQIRSKFPNIQVIALTSFTEEQLVHDALAAGAISYLLKSISPADLVDAIRKAAHDKAVIAPEVKHVLAQQSDNLLHHETLTNREWQIFRSLMAGNTNAEIAQKLVISVSTVKFHVSNILSKLGVTNRSEAIAYAIQHHLMD